MRQRVRSLYFKNFMTVVLLLCLSSLVLGGVFAGMSYEFIIRDKTQTMHNNAETAGRMVAAYLQEWHMDGLEVKAMLMWLSDTTGFHIIVTDMMGDVMNCSDPQMVCPHTEGSINAGIIRQINQTGKFSGISDLSGAYGGDRYTVGIMLPHNEMSGESGGCIFLSGETAQMAAVWRRLVSILLLSAVAVILIALGLTMITTSKQTRPIKQMAQAANRFAKGDFSARVDELDRDDEIGELAESFNAMADFLERSEKMRRELIANVSHELKTPMTTITGFADGILDGTIPPEKQRDYLMVISSETKRLSRLVRGMLDMSQVQELDESQIRGESFDILEVVCQTLLSLEQKITKRGLDVDAQLPEEPIMVTGSRDAITQVVYNLIDNAAKFALPDTQIELKLWKEDNKAYVSVQNKGESISKEELPLIFDRFHKTDRSRSLDTEGVGLGLYIVKKILDSHGEDIFVTSRDGVTGFTFTLSLVKS